VRTLRRVVAFVLISLACGMPFMVPSGKRVIFWYAAARLEGAAMEDGRWNLDKVFAIVEGHPLRNMSIREKENVVTLREYLVLYVYLSEDLSDDQDEEMLLWSQSNPALRKLFGH
jgi:hypothetical protein